MTNEIKTRVLLIEDSEIDALLIVRELEKAMLNPVVRRVETSGELQKELSRGEIDVVISDYILPRFNGTEALAIVREADDELPFILVSGKIGEEQAAEAIRTGANDYIMKSNLFRLGVAVKKSMEDAVIKMERRKAREELEKSLGELKRRTDQLADSNRKMLVEIGERKKAQNDVLESREYLKSVIDSAPELVFSIDKNLRVSTWNKSLQNVTGYDEKEMILRNVEKLAAFSSATDLIKMLKSENIFPSNRIEFTLMTKDGVKKVIQTVGSIIRGTYNQDLGMLFIGRDITPNIEEHGRLIDGMSYLIKDRGMKSSIDLFLNMSRAGKKGLFITRANPSIVSSWLPPSSNIEVMMLSVNFEKNISSTISSLLLQKIQTFTSDDVPSVILLDGSHYFFATVGFPKFLDMIFQLSEALAGKKSILFVRVDPNLIDEEKMAFLENELLLLPSQRIEDVVIEDDIYALLRFVHEQNENNSLVSLKKISSKFQISHVTVARRIENLEQDGLIYVKKIGKQRAPFLTEKGKALLAKKRTA